MTRRHDENASAVRYLANGLGMTDAVNRTMDIATFAAGRSKAVTLLDAWEREELGYSGICVCNADAECVFHGLADQIRAARAL